VEWLARKIEEANQRLLVAQQQQPEWRGIGAALAAVLVVGATAHIAHVGDVRVYLLRGGRIEPLTEEHSLQKLHPGADLSSKVIVRVLGAPGVSPDLRTHALIAEDVLLLCSDGLWSVMPEPEIATILSGKTLARAVDELVCRAKARSGLDDVTAVALSFILA
jgi:serine/threonine protein phosphatase PrpC